MSNQLPQHIVDAESALFPGETKEKPKGKQKGNKTKSKQKPNPRRDPPSVFPFRVLGVTDQNRAFFIGRNNRLVDIHVHSITKNHLLNLAPISWWKSEYGVGERVIRVDWEEATDFVLQISGRKDFDEEKIRGRGAWKEINGDLCYHDGLNTIGAPSEKRLYLRKTKKDIGLGDPPADLAIRKAISRTVSSMTFETPLDAQRLLGWAALAPFAGALPWRPALLITGPSEAGKSSVVDYVLSPGCLPYVFSGGETSEAGVRQKIRNDAAPIVIEEAEKDTPKKKQRRDELFSLMRQSTSDNAPKSAKGTQNQMGVSYVMRSMFCFVAISPEVEAIADDNRIFRINMAKKENDWKGIKASLKEQITEKNCRAIRAFVWQNLKKIIDYAETLGEYISDMTGKNARAALADALLMSAYWIVWQGLELDEKQARNTIEFNAQFDQTEIAQDEAYEFVNKILDHSVFVGGDFKKKMTIRILLRSIFTGKLEQGKLDDVLDKGSVIEFRETVGQYGLNVTRGGDVCFAINHPQLMNEFQIGRGFHRQINRHKNIKEKDKRVYVSGLTRRCVIVSDLLNEEGPMEETAKKEY